MTQRFAALFTLTLLAAGAALPLAAGRAEEIDPEPPGIWPKTTAAHRKRSAENLQQIGIAFHNFHDAYGAMPANAIRDRAGKPLLSWRVALLPFLEEDNLFKEFRLDEPWDSKHNKKLLENMPKVYAPTITGKPAKPNTTYYQVFTGPDTPFNPKTARGQGISTLGLRLADMTDGTSNTILAVEGGQAVPWTKPEDIEYDASKPIPKLGGLFKESIQVLFGDGVVRRADRKVDTKTLRMLIDPRDGQGDGRNLPEAK